MVGRAYGSGRAARAGGYDEGLGWIDGEAEGLARSVACAISDLQRERGGPGLPGCACDLRRVHSKVAH